MCDWPTCTDHKGTVMLPVDGKPRHCETADPIHLCPYLELGCLGCTLKRPAFATVNIVVVLNPTDRSRFKTCTTVIEQPGAVSSVANQIAQLRKTRHARRRSST